LFDVLKLILGHSTIPDCAVRPFISISLPAARVQSTN
jgi:hypothetical protein